MLDYDNIYISKCQRFFEKKFGENAKTFPLLRMCQNIVFIRVYGTKYSLFSLPFYLFKVTANTRKSGKIAVRRLYPSEIPLFRHIFTVLCSSYSLQIKRRQHFGFYEAGSQGKPRLRGFQATFRSPPAAQLRLGSPPVAVHKI